MSVVGEAEPSHKTEITGNEATKQSEQTIVGTVINNLPAGMRAWRVRPHCMSQALMESREERLQTPVVDLVAQNTKKNFAVFLRIRLDRNTSHCGAGRSYASQGTVEVSS